MLGTNSLAEILSNREAVSKCMREILDDATDDWGIKVERVEIKDVRLPISLQRAMATEAEAAREARAKVIAAEGEQKAAKALRNAADILKVKYLLPIGIIFEFKNYGIFFSLRNFFLQYSYIYFLINRLLGRFGRFEGGRSIPFCVVS